MNTKNNGEELKGKCIVLGVTGCIAAYKAATMVGMLRRLGADVNVVMTKNATQFITPMTMRTLSNNPVLVDMFRPITSWQIEHIELSQKADLILIVPATANMIGKIASGIADDMLSTIVMATKATVLIAPAMNVNMYENPIVQGNLEKLKSFGYHFVGPDVGKLATGIVGKGRLAKLDKIVGKVCKLLK